jgi:hypothetical protein
MNATGERYPDLAVHPAVLDRKAEPTPLMKDVVIGRTTSWALLLSFVLLICLPAMHQFVVLQQGRFRLTDESLAALRDAGVPEDVLAKLNPLRDRALDREQFLAELTQLLDPGELRRFQNLVLTHSRRESHLRTLARLFQEFPTHESLASYEKGLADDSELGKVVRRRYQALLTRTLKQGSEQVVIGTDGFLFYREDVEFAIGEGILSEPFRRAARAAQAPGQDVFQAALESLFGRKAEGDGERRPEEWTDPIAVLADLHEQFRERGIHLVVVPIPVAPVIYPEKLWPGYPLEAGPAWNPDYGLWKKHLADAGVDLLDLGDALWDAKATAKAPLFLKTDTHWSPEGMAVAADRIAAHVKPLLNGFEPRSFAARNVPSGTAGELERMLDLPPGWSPFSPLEFEITEVLQGDQLATPGDKAPVLLLGDSFATIYNEEGEAAGLPAHLMLRLGTGVQSIAEAGGGGTVLANQERLVDQPGILAHKKVVILAFVTRSLSQKGMVWRKEALPPVPEAVSEPIDPSLAEGTLDSADAESVFGWAWVKSHPDNTIDVDIYDGDTLLATVTAGQFREDLRDAQLGKGYHAFLYTLPPEVRNGKPHMIRVTIAGTNKELAGSPRTLEGKATTQDERGAGKTVDEMATGVLELVSGDGIAGWAWDSQRPDSPVKVDIFDGDTKLDTVPAGMFREDLLREKLGNGRHAFTYPLPARLKDGKSHTIRVTIAGTSKELEGSPKTLAARNR